MVAVMMSVIMAVSLKVKEGQASYEGARCVQKVHKCYFCNKPGHKKAECLKRIAWMERRSIHSVSVCFEFNFIEVPSNTWWLDTGATTHVSNIMQGFLMFQPQRENEKFLFM